MAGHSKWSNIKHKKSPDGRKKEAKNILNWQKNLLLQPVWVVETGDELQTKTHYPEGQRN